MSQELTPWIREDVLRMGARLASDRSDPALVAAHAAHLAEWLASAADGPDLQARHRALYQRDADKGKLRADGAWQPDDDPAALIREAQVYLPVLTGSA